MRNMKKKVDFLRDQLDHPLLDVNTDSASDQDSDEDDTAHIIIHQAKKKGQRAGVSAEVYGLWNKKGDFKPKVVQKNQETREKLKSRLLHAFMFNALEKDEFEIVVDSIEEKKVNAG